MKPKGEIQQKHKERFDKITHFKTSHPMVMSKSYLSLLTLKNEILVRKFGTSGLLPD